MAEFGFDIIDGRKVKNEYEQKMIEVMLYWRNKEGLSFDKIAKKLTEMGVKGKLGAVNWGRSIVKKMILRNSN
jgi:16S rRNA U1498 N3-methylase RsmE